MPWKHFNSNGTRHRDTRTGNSASGECTMSSWHQLISARVRASVDPGAMAKGLIPRIIMHEFRGLVFEFKNARDLNGVKIDIYVCFYTKLVVIDKMTLFNVLQTADFSTVTGIHHVVAVHFANFRAYFLLRYGFKLAGSSSKILGIRSQLHAFIIEVAFIVESIWKPTILARGRLIPIDRHYEQIVCVHEVTSLCTSKWRRLFSLAALMTSNKKNPFLLIGALCNGHVTHGNWF